LGQKWISAIISETMGTFFFVVIFLISTDKATKFSQDKVVNCFIIASSYIAARILSGGMLVTGVNNSTYYSSDMEQKYFTGP
jgi:glycerol uptake facilitator-like aquaporin